VFDTHESVWVWLMKDDNGTSSSSDSSVDESELLVDEDDVIDETLRSLLSIEHRPGPADDC